MEQFLSVVFVMACKLQPISKVGRLISRDSTVDLHKHTMYLPARSSRCFESAQAGSHLTENRGQEIRYWAEP